MNLNWYKLDRQELPQALMGETPLPGGNPSELTLADGSDVVLGMSPLDQNGTSVAAVALLGNRRAELFSWVSTYAEEIFPLTQFCRVCFIEDWIELDLQGMANLSIGRIHPIWPSIVLGEMLGQSDSTGEVAGTPLARATACFSFALARTTILYPGLEKAEYKCIERMEKVGREPRFARRNITVDALKRVWQVALILQKVPRGPSNLVDEIAQIVAAVNGKAAKLLTANRLLMSDSAEDRVVGFDEVVDAFVDMRDSDVVGRDGGAVALAAAALLVGRGTSHIQLLAPAAKLFPEALVWYGLLAGVLGPKAWDKAWMQQAKGVERALRQFFRPDEPVVADLCWPEYEWLSQTYDSIEALSTVPKSAPRSLAIELLPGVNCQFRLAGKEPNARIHEESQLAETEAKVRPPAVTEGAIAHAVDLLAQVQQLLRPQKAPGFMQERLFESELPSRQDRQTRRKSGSKTSKTSSS